MSLDQLPTTSLHPAGRPTARERAEARRAADEVRVRAARRQRTVTGAVTAAIVVAAVVLLAIAVQTQRTSSAADAAVPANTVDGGAAIEVGAADAPAVIDIYEDFQCPACAQFEALDAEILAELAADGSARVRYHPIAFLDRVSPDRYSTRSLNAAAVVVDEAGPEAFVRFAGLLYARQPVEGHPGLTDDHLIEVAAEAGASGPEVARGIRELVFEDWTRTVTDQASKDGVNGTPTVLLDGEPLDWYDLAPDELAAAVRAAG